MRYVVKRMRRTGNPARKAASALLPTAYMDLPVTVLVRKRYAIATTAAPMRMTHGTPGSRLALPMLP
jgi:hypothetical protein